MNHEDFVSRLNEVLPSLVAISTYQNCRTKVLVRCNICDYQWEARSSDLLRGHGCPRCSWKERKTTDRFRYEVSVVNPNVEVIGAFQDMVKQIVKDPFFLQKKSEKATKADKQVIEDLLDTLRAN